MKPYKCLSVSNTEGPSACKEKEWVKGMMEDRGEGNGKLKSEAAHFRIQLTGAFWF